MPGAVPEEQVVGAPEVDWAAAAALFEREGRRAGRGRAAAELLYEAGRLRAAHLRDVAGAEALWQSAAEADPSFATGGLAAAEREVLRACAEGRHHDRLDALERCAELTGDPGAAAAHLAAAAAVAEERLERPTLAADLALRAFELAPGDAALRREARRHAEREGRDAALARVLEAEAGDPSTPAREASLALCALARLLASALGDEEGARVRLREARQRGGEDPVALDAVAALHEVRGEWELAAEALRARGAALPAGTPGELSELVAGHLRLAEICEEQLGRPDEAAACYEAALSLAPGHRAALAALGRRHAQAGDWERLLGTFLAERDAAVDPRDKAHRAYKAGEVLEERLARPGEAIERYREALALDPSLTAARHALERLCESSGRHAELAALLEEDLARSERPEQQRIAALMRLAGHLEDRVGDPAAAVAALERILSLEPTHRPALRALGRLYAASSRWSDLVRMCRAEAEVAPSPAAAAELHFRAAEVLERRLGDRAEALAGHREVLTFAPDHLGALGALARLERAAGAWESLAEVLRAQAAARTAPHRRAELLAEVAELWETRLGDRDQAIEVHLEALAEVPAHATSLRALDRLLAASGRYAELATLLRAQGAATSGPARAAALVRAARLFAERLRDRDAALEACRAALAEAPDDAGARQLLWELEPLAPRSGEPAATDPFPAIEVEPFLSLAVAEGHEAAGELDEAAEALRRALVANPGSLPAVHALARVALRRGDRAEARNALRSEAALLGDEAAAAAALHQAGDLSVQLADAAGAAADFADALQRTPGDGAAAARLAAILREAPSPAELLGGPERALALADAALAAAPELADGLRVRARLLGEAGQAADAARDLARLLAVADGEERAGLHVQLASLYEAPLADAARAMSHLQAALAAAPANALALERLAALQRRSRNSPGEADALTRLLALPDLPPQLRVRHLLALAELRAEAFGDGAAALALCEEAQRLAPDDAEVMAALARHRPAEPAPSPMTAAIAVEVSASAEMHPAHPEPEHPEAPRPDAASGPAAAISDAAPLVADAAPASDVAAEQRRCLAEDPARLEAWRALLRHEEASGAQVRARLVRAVLRFIGDPDAEHGPMAQMAHERQVAPAPLSPLTDADWLALRHPGDPGPLSDILALASEALCEVAQLPAPPRARERDAELPVQVVEEACRAFGLRPFPLRAGAGVDLAAVTLVPGEPVLVYAGPKLAGAPLSAQRFLLGRAAARVRARSALAARLSTPALRELIAAAVRLVAPRTESLGVPPDGVARAVACAVPRKVRRALEKPVDALLSGAPPDVAAWQAALAATADRCGLLLCGDPLTALATVAEESGLAAATPAERAAAARAPGPVRDLLLFVAGEDHLGLRERLARPPL